MSDTENILNTIQASIDTKRELISDCTFAERINECIEKICIAFRSGHKLWLCGNGGSAADAQHIAAELTGRFFKDRKALPAEALHTNSSYMTAVANDYGFDKAYERMIDGIAKEKDILIALSTSGNSANILAAVKRAKEKNIFCIGLTGETGGEMKDLCDVLLNIPSTSTPRIQETHILIGHIICEQVEKKIFNA